MKNRKRIEEAISKDGYKVGCYNEDIEKLSTRSMNRLLEELEFYDHTDVPVTFNRKKFIVEIATVDNEKDFNIMSIEEYNSRYKI